MKAPCFFSLSFNRGINDSSHLPWVDIYATDLRRFVYGSALETPELLASIGSRRLCTGSNQKMDPRKWTAGSPKKWRSWRGWKMFFFPFFPFPIEAFSGSMLSMLFVFGFVWRDFRPEKGGLSLSSPGNSYGDLIRPSRAGPVIRCWNGVFFFFFDRLDLSSWFPHGPNLGICWVSESPLWCRTWFKNFYRKTAGRHDVSTHERYTPAWFGPVLNSRVYIFFSCYRGAFVIRIPDPWLPYLPFYILWQQDVSCVCQELMADGDVFFGKKSATLKGWWYTVKSQTLQPLVPFIPYP